jgi:Arc/MetJ-type ribon-helix-helix transcriptional regulator
MSTEQIAVRVSADLLARLDDLVGDGVFKSRAAAVRAGIEAVTEAERRRLIDRAVVEGYRRRPPTELEDSAALDALRRTIQQEPW